MRIWAKFMIVLRIGTLDNKTYEDRWSIQIVGDLIGQNLCYLYLYIIVLTL